MSDNCCLCKMIHNFVSNVRFFGGLGLLWVAWIVWDEGSVSAWWAVFWAVLGVLMVLSCFDYDDD